MTPEELAVGTQLLNQTQMILGQGWDVLVYGTIVSNSLYAISIVLTIVVFIVTTKLIYNHDDDCICLSDAAIGGFLAGILSLMVLAILSSVVIGIICPEYVITQDIIGSLNPN